MKVRPVQSIQEDFKNHAKKEYGLDVKFTRLKKGESPYTFEDIFFDMVLLDEGRMKNAVDGNTYNVVNDGLKKG